jgi:hypothetical protein
MGKRSQPELLARVRVRQKMGGEWPPASPRSGGRRAGLGRGCGNSYPAFGTESGDPFAEGSRGAGRSLIQPEAKSATDYLPERDMTFAQGTVLVERYLAGEGGQVRDSLSGSVGAFCGLSYNAELKEGNEPACGGPP